MSLCLPRLGSNFGTTIRHMVHIVHPLPGPGNMVYSWVQKRAAAMQCLNYFPDRASDEIQALHIFADDSSNDESDERIAYYQAAEGTASSLQI